MISREYIQAWKSHVLWGNDAQVEQDLIISRALCELYSAPLIQKSLAFRGGTSLQKVFFDKPQRYSEDIDLVQIPKESMGKVADLARDKLVPWLGKPQVDKKKGRFTMRFRFDSTVEPIQKMKLKVEINIAEHFSIFGHETRKFSMASDFYSGECEVTTFTIEEIMGTKLRALHQRRKGRDLFDFACVFREFPKISHKNIVESFLKYMEYDGHRVSRAEFEMDLHQKKQDPDFLADMSALLPIGAKSFDHNAAFADLEKNLVTIIPGEPWKGVEAAVEKKKSSN